MRAFYCRTKLAIRAIQLLQYLSHLISDHMRDASVKRSWLRSNKKPMPNANSHTALYSPAARSIALAAPGQRAQTVHSVRPNVRKLYKRARENWPARCEAAARVITSAHLCALSRRLPVFYARCCMPMAGSTAQVSPRGEDRSRQE